MLTACVTSEVRGMDLSPGEQLFRCPWEISRGWALDPVENAVENVETP